MSAVKIVLKRSPMDPENGVWIDGVKLDGVMKVTVSGSVQQVPTVSIKLIPKSIEVALDDPDIKQN